MVIPSLKRQYGGHCVYEAAQKEENVRNKVLVFDFDGTIALGDGPVRSYARHVAETLPAAARESFLVGVEAGLEGELPDIEPVDGYELVCLLGDRFQVSDADRSRAFLLSRGELATDAAPIAAPPGLAELLAAARAHAHLVLATNSPDIRIDRALEALGLADAFDTVHTSVGKPAGLGAVVDGWLRTLPGEPGEVLLSIGDIWVNDLEPAHERGASTALVAPRADAAATPTFTATHLEDLYPSLSQWLGMSAPTPHRSTSTTSLATDQR